MRMELCNWKAKIALSTIDSVKVPIPARPDRHGRSDSSSSLSFAAPSNIQGGVTPEQIANLMVGQLCQLGVSYDDTLGMRIFQGWQTGPSCAY
jgi:hypothetical protein